MLRLKSSIHHLCLLTLGLNLCFPETSNASDACSNTSNILSLSNRPSIAVSPCVVLAKHILIELGFERRALLTGSYLNDYPNTLFRFGLGQDTELFAATPIVIDTHAPPLSGYTTFSLGAKHVFLEKNSFVFTLDGAVAPPGGSYYYGFQTTTGGIDGILNYNSEPWNINFTFGGVYQSQPYNLPHQNSIAFGPDLVLSYSLNSDLYVFGEIYGLSKTSPSLGCGFNFNGGLGYAIGRNIMVDIEASSRIVGTLGQFKTYIGFGGAVQL